MDNNAKRVWNSLNKQYKETGWDDIKEGDVLFHPPTKSTNLVLIVKCVFQDFVSAEESEIIFLESRRGLLKINPVWFTERVRTLEVVTPNSNLHLECLKRLDEAYKTELNKTMVDTKKLMPLLKKCHDLLDQNFIYYDAR